MKSLEVIATTITKYFVEILALIGRQFQFALLFFHVQRNAPLHVTTVDLRTIPDVGHGVVSPSIHQVKDHLV